MKLNICLLPGDGIGPEIVAQAMKVLEAVCKRFGHSLETTRALLGGCAIDATGDPLPQATVDACLAADAVLLGAVGGPKWDNLPNTRPEAGLLGIRKAMAVYANLRPAALYPELQGACLLRPEIAARGIDLLVVRELTGGAYFGEPKGEAVRGGKRVAFDNMIYDEDEIRRILHVGFKAARGRKKRLCCADKANVLASSRLWRAVAREVAPEYPDVDFSFMLADNTAMQLVRDPAQFDVIVTENLFGDILSDEAAVITGSIGMLASASLGDGTRGLYEPIHGSAPDIAGQDKANPLATILSVAMMLRYTWRLEQEAVQIEQAVRAVLAQGYRTGDIMEPGKTLVGTKQMGDLAAAAL